MRLLKAKKNSFCPTCGSKNFEIKKEVEKQSILKEAVYRVLSQVELSSRETYICKDCDKWWVSTEKNKPGTGGNNESGTEVIDTANDTIPTDQPEEKSQKS